jgi:hypothetical protein
VEPICRVLGVSASAYYQHATGDRCERSVEDERLLARIGGLHAANFSIALFALAAVVLAVTGAEALSATWGTSGARRSPARGCCSFFGA